MPNTPNSAGRKSSLESTDKRQLYVVDDVSSMPLMESRRFFDSFGQWVSAAIRHKLMRTAIEPDYLVEFDRFKSARHIPKRIQKYFDNMTRDLSALEFAESFHGTVSALGPYSTATLGMSRKDGEIHFFATQVVTQIDRQIQDENYFGFISWLKDGGSIWTVSPSRLPSPRPGVDRMTLSTHRPAEVLRKHRDRIRSNKLRAVAPKNYFDSFQSEHVEQANDWVRRRVIRRAKPAEVTRIRKAIEA